MIFEQLGIVCTAPIDGHNIHTLRETLSSVLRADGPVLVHVVTKKGHGYGPAEADPETFHGVGPYDIPTGKQLKKSGGAPSYTNVFGEALVHEAEANPDVVGITAAMKGGTGLTKLGERFPDRCIDAGIAEENAVGMAAGLAVGGKKPVVAIYSTFMQRAIDQMIHGQRAVAQRQCGVLRSTARAWWATTARRTTACSTWCTRAWCRACGCSRRADEAELVHGLHTALALGGPFCHALSTRGAAEGVPLPDAPEVHGAGRGASRARRFADVAILALGRMAGQAACARRSILAEDQASRRAWWTCAGRSRSTDTAIKNAAQTKLVVTIEEGVVCGGAGEGVLEVLSELGLAVPTLVLGIPDRFVGQGKVDLLFKEIGLDPEGIASRIREELA